MCASRRTILLVACVLALSASGCDPAYTYQPVDARGQRLSQWSETIGGVRFSTRPFVILTGSSGAVVPLDITNDSDKEVVVLGGQLVTGGRTIEADVPDEPANRVFRTVPAGESKSVVLGWSFGTASKALGPDLTWVWRVRIGDAEHPVRVPMQRQER